MRSPRDRVTSRGLKWAGGLTQPQSTASRGNPTTMPHPSLRDLENPGLSLREYAVNHLLIVLRPDESVLLMKRVQRMTIVLLSVPLAVYAGLCLVFLLSQRSFIYFPTPLRPDNASAIPLQTPDATLQISTRAHDGTQALIYFGGNAEDVSYSLPEFAAAFPEKAIFMMHYRGYSGSSGRPSESALHRDAKELFKMVHAALRRDCYRQKPRQRGRDPIGLRGARKPARTHHSF